jgi:colanic acid biosynthesis protein WcaH
MWIRDELYDAIRTSMPIPCVDLVVLNKKKQVLLLKRKNDPAKGTWWFPGGRINFLESRSDAAIRKLREECGLSGEVVAERGTFDIILPLKNHGFSHAITTLFEIKVQDIERLNIDKQSEVFSWHDISDIVNGEFHQFIVTSVSDLQPNTGSNRILYTTTQ